ncbi:MBL fold metallo-hydrolase [soil metagenome]
MKKWLVRIGFVIIFILLGLGIFIVIDQNDTAKVEKFVRNESFPTIKAEWKGTPIDQKDRFVNVEFPFLPKITDLLKWTWETNPQKAEKQNDTKRLDVLDPTDFLSGDENGILWLGHASFYIRLDNKIILLDPVFGKPPLVSAFVDVPSPLENIKQVDYVLISHDHRDHCDENSIRQIAEKFPDAKFLAGLRMDELLKDWIKNTENLQTAGWFQQFTLPDENLKIYFLPVRHWSRRGLFDTNERLWGGFIIQGANKTIYFSGDSGYGNHYRETAELFPDIDYFLIGIGAYEPRWFMKPNHNNPADALQAFQEANAKFLVPMHFGRFDLSDEPPSEPLRLLKENAAELNLSDKIKPLNINESLKF